MNIKHSSVHYPSRISSLLYSFFLSIRPKTLAVTVVPVTVGTLLTDLPLAKIDWVVAVCALLCAVCIQIAANLINDAFDVKKGVDTKERTGPLRGLHTGVLTVRQVYVSGLVFLGTALLLGIPLALKGGAIIAVFIATSVILSYSYTGGPYPLSYLGLGDFFAFSFYGILNTLVCYYLQTGVCAWQVILAGIQMGCFPTAIIAINNYRDHEADAKAGKKTLAVRFGAQFSRLEIILCLTIPFLLNFIWLFFVGNLLAPLFSTTACFFAVHIINGIRRHPPSQLYNRFLAETALLQVLFGTLFIIGFRIEI